MKKYLATLLRTRSRRWTGRHDIALPSLPRDKTGVPDVRALERWRSYRTSYDWKAYDQRQLAIMESYWDDCVTLFESLLPSRFAASPGSYRGLNLGTFNGAFQKAWMRRGYEMYGIEISDVVDELHEYGCEGERGNFFRLQGLADKSFDFAIMDRAYFLKEAHGYRLNPETERYIELTAQPSDNNDGSHITVPPFFSEVFRVLKNDAAFLGIFYPHWTSVAMQELYDQGHVEIWPVRRKRPYLAACVDRAKRPSKLPRAEEFCAKLQKMAEVDALEYLGQNKLIWNPIAIGSGRVKFHFLPENRLVTYNTFDGQISSNIESVNDPRGQEFFFGSGSIFCVGGTGKRVSATCIISLIDEILIGRLSDNNRVLEEIRDQKRLYSHQSLDRGGKSIVPVWRQLQRQLDGTKEFTDAVVIIGNTPRDACVDQRSGKPRLEIEQSLEATMTVAKEVRQFGALSIVLLPPDVSGPKWLPEQSDAIAEFRSRLTSLAHEVNAKLIDIAIERNTAERTDSLAALLTNKEVRQVFARTIRVAIG